MPTPQEPSAVVAGAQPDAAATESSTDCRPWLVNLGWFNTTLALGLHILPLQLLLKDQLHLDAEQVARFMLIANVPTYCKPIAGVISDAFPLFGTRRKHYVVFGFLLAALFWQLLAFVPRTFGSLLTTYLALNLFLVLVSTVLGGLMVEVGKQRNQTGTLGAQRHGITHLTALISGPAGGVLARQAFLWPASLCAAAYAVAAAVFWFCLKERGGQRVSSEPLRKLRQQAELLVASRNLWMAAGLIVLVALAPGLGTPLLFHQTNTLKFTPEFIGLLTVVASACAAAAAWLYARLCRRFTLRTVLAISIVLHGVLALFYLLYRSEISALIITGVEGATISLAILPLYDLAARGTPRGSEALGFAIIMSVWNLASRISDYAGSWMYSRWGLTFDHLVWVNSGTTLLVLFAIPLLPAALADRRDDDRGGTA